MRDSCFSNSFLPPAMEFCQFLWNQQSLNQTLPGSPSVDVSHENLAKITTDLYPNLEFLEIVSLVELTAKNSILKNGLDLTELFKAYGFQWNDRVQMILDIFPKLPYSFKIWARERKLSLKDISPLFALKDVLSFESHLDEIAEKNPSRSEGKDILDWLIDLFLMGNLESWKAKSPTTWKAEVYTARFPQTVARDTSANLELNLPKYAKYSTTRSGDRLKHTISLEFETPKDGVQKMNTITQKLQDTLK